jgi:hypothetical protein
MVGLTFLDLGAENGASSAPPALQEFFRGARQFFPGPPNFSPSMLCGSNFLQRFSKKGDTPQSILVTYYYMARKRFFAKQLLVYIEKSFAMRLF